MLKNLLIIISLISFIYKPLAQHSQSNRSSKEKRANSGALTPLPLPRWPPSCSNVTEIKKKEEGEKKGKNGTLERSLRMNYVADQPANGLLSRGNLQ